LSNPVAVVSAHVEAAEIGYGNQRDLQQLVVQPIDPGLVLQGANFFRRSFDGATTFRPNLDEEDAARRAQREALGVQRGGIQGDQQAE